MNLVLHGIDGDANAPVPIEVKDALAGKQGEYEMVLTNPPFGKKSSVTIVNQAGETSKESLIINRDDFWASTSNKQLNFLQHVFTILKQHGRAAVVVPDNVLFEGGAGETVRRELLNRPTSTRCCACRPDSSTRKGSRRTSSSSTANPQPTNRRGRPSSGSTTCGQTHFTLKENPLKRADLDDFVACYSAKDRTKRTESQRWKAFTYEALIKRDKVAQRRVPGRQREPPRPRCDRCRNRRRPGGRSGAICCHCRGLEKIDRPQLDRFSQSWLPYTSGRFAA
jgi:type I restriction enzyme M protein